ncbi:uncharacterized protein misp3 [Gadus morhua]|uniref:A-kinase anchor protein 2 C-terminal domain-containing protein n=1 Tax=Gadus morhua TaxID=8049 RepID=A0A8C5A4Q0_GADMO|nr:uncharacterized protein MISP3 [Gadus morhua]
MVRCLEIEESPDRIRMTEKPSSLSIPKLNGGSKMDSYPYEDNLSDSGVSADFSTSSTFDNLTIKTNETPIEQEIRRAVQREQSLRKSRGIKHVPPTTEYVEIPLKKPVLYSGLPVKTEQNQGKDRQIAGKKMQKEIHAEVQREQALVRLGTVPGVYDKGTVRQLKERKQLFEAFQEPRDSSGNLTPRTSAPSWASTNDLSPGENQEKASTAASPAGGLSSGRGRSMDLLNQKQQQQKSPTSSPWNKPGGSTSSTSPKGPGLSEGNGYQVIILESNLPSLSLYPPQPLQQNQRAAPLMQKQAVNGISSGTSSASASLGREDGLGRTEGEEEEEEEEEPHLKENPFFKLRPSLAVDKVEQDIREAQQRERELRRQRTSLYGAARARGEEKASGGGLVNGGGEQPSPCCVTSPSVNPLAPRSELFSLRPRLAGAPSARQSLGRLGLWPPPSQDEEKNDIQLESPRAARQKTPLLQHWETGLVNMGHNDEDQ